MWRGSIIIVCNFKYNYQINCFIVKKVIIPLLVLLVISLGGVNDAFADELTVRYNANVQSFVINYDFPNNDNCVTRTGVFGGSQSSPFDNPYYFPMNNTMVNGTIMYDWFDLQYYNQLNSPVERIDCSGFLVMPIEMFAGESDFRIWTYFYESTNSTRWDPWNDPLIHQTFIEFTETTFDPNRSYGGCAVEVNLSVDNSTIIQRTMNPNGTCTIVFP